MGLCSAQRPIFTNKKLSYMGAQHPYSGDILGHRPNIKS